MERVKKLIEFDKRKKIYNCFYPFIKPRLLIKLKFRSHKEIRRKKDVRKRGEEGKREREREEP